ncbi:prepilin-type N-terminal cleavage/methylation domain-containing protein [bacterium]|jgi:prepilin-type N-terminal cleavage/methylation domain-containing protein|nr:prepilin-type N-terminal cleavage/methylation domain-containing protein [bacterium]
MNRLIKQAFTLIELLVVIAIIGILSGLIVVSMSGVTQKANIARLQVFSNSIKNSIMIDLVSEWRLEGNANDSWGINNGSFVGTPIILTSGCVRDGCVEFDSNDDYLNMGNNSSLNFSSDYTIEMFVYNGVGSVLYPTLFNRTGQSATNGYFWTYIGGTNKEHIYYQYSNGSTYTSVSFSNVLPKNQWAHLVFTFTDSDKSLRLYVDGNYITTKTLTGALPVDDGTLFFGSYGSNPTIYWFKGKMDEMRWYHATMPAYVIKEHYYSALNNMLVLGEITEKEYSNLIYDRH